jgi:hypothetical protein
MKKHLTPKHLMQKAIQKAIVSTLIIALFFSVSSLADVSFEQNVIVVDVDYNLFRSRGQQTISSATNPFSLRNSGSADVSVNLSVTQLPAGYSTNIQELSIPGDSTMDDFQVTLSIPHRESPGDKKIGVVTLSTGQNVDLVQRTKSMLSFKKLRVEYVDESGKNQKGDYSPDKEKILELDEPIKPGTQVVLTVDIENLFDNGYDRKFSTLEDVELIIDVDRDLLETRFKDDIQFGNLAARDKSKEIIRFTISEDAEEDEYIIGLTLRAEDGKGIRYKLQRDLRLQIGRQKDDVRITKAIISPSTISACDVQFEVDFSIKNIGTRDQRDVSVMLKNAALGISEEQTRVRIDKFSDRDSKWSKVFSFSRGNVTAGSYPLDIVVRGERGRIFDAERITLELAECRTQENSGSVASPPMADREQDAVLDVDLQPVVGQPPATTRLVENQVSGDDMRISILVGAIIIGLVGMGVLLYVGFRRK